MDRTFQNPTIGRCSSDEMIDSLLDYVNDCPRQSYSITVGCDSSQRYDHATFVGVVAIRRIGSGGRYFWNRFELDRFPSLRQRIYAEAQHSLDLASDLHEEFEDRVSLFPEEFDFDMEIHVDIGDNGPTHEMITEIVSMIRGQGYEVCTKPEAYCAAVVADKYA